MKNRNDKYKYRDTIAFVILAFMCIMMAWVTISCTPRVVEVVKTEVIYRDRVIRDTVEYKVPVIVEKIVTRDTVSHIENPFAKSDAMVMGGFLSHSLETKPHLVKVPVEIDVHDTTYIEKQAEITTITEYIEKPLSKWKSFQIRAFWWLCVLAFGLLLWVFRKPILKLITTL